MSVERIAHQVRMTPPEPEIPGLLYSHGATVPADGTAGYATGCIFAHTDGGAGTAFYINEGSVTSSTFAAVAGLTAAQEALLGATAGTATASTALILNSSGQVDAGTLRLDDMAEGSGLSAADSIEHSVVKVGGLYKTTIVVEIDGLNSGATGDIIGTDGGAANCHLGQITAAKNGTIFAGSVTCLEVPAGGDVDIDLYSATEATGAEDTAISALTETALLTAGGNWTAALTRALTAFPAADEYLYLTSGGAGADATYTAGILLIELWGK